VTAGYRSLQFSERFLTSFTDRDFSAQERRQFLKALRLLDDNEQHPSLWIHPLHGQDEGIWSMSASDALRITFLRIDSGRKVLLVCSRHYDR
jgi:mRNA-degrading endonuclease YafQ of YafQ-DinJ toxin-antitoxin module